MPFDSTTTSLLTSLHSVPHVWAYLDPGAGSMLLQILLATAMSSAFFMKSWIRQVRDGMLIRNKKV
jgi:hypothetical protein